MKKYIPNILSTCRIIIASILLWYSELTVGFLKLFCVAELTDLFDGPTARKTNSVSLLGSKLDTYGDVLICASVAKILLFNQLVKMQYIVIVLCAGIAIVVSSFIGLKRFGSFFFIHTISAKVLGFSCFFLPFSALMNSLDFLLSIICFILIVLAIESIIIQAKATVASPDARSVFSLSKSTNNEE